jgi:crotonobetainyl-CoA:carnitine CoA-transferase CaiB-like acyl-CoA transferase
MVRGAHGHDVCFAPVLSLTERRRIRTSLARDIHAARRWMQPSPAPRFSRNAGQIARRAPQRGKAAALAEWGFDAAEIARFRTAGALMTDE